MGMRKYKRQIAKARLRVLGVGNVNKQLAVFRGGVQNWRLATSGETGKAAEQAQLRVGARGAKLKKRKIRKVSA